MKLHTCTVCDTLCLQMHEMLKYITSPTDFEDACKYAKDVREPS